MNCFDLKKIKMRKGEFLLSIDDFSLEKGNIYGVVGPNGCGKSTFLNLLTLLEHPEEGDYFISGKKVDYNNPTEILKYRRNIAYLLQNPYLFNTTVYDNVAYGLRIRKEKESEIEKKVNFILQELSLFDKRRKNAYQLSGGEGQRVAVARTFVLDTDIIVLDEPTSSIDKKNMNLIENFIITLFKRHKKTILFTTHFQDQAYRLTSEIISIIDGKIQSIAYENVFEGTLKQDKNHFGIFNFGEKGQICVGSERIGSATVAIDPQDILLSANCLESSALNNLCGTINKIEEINGSLRVFVDVGFTLCSLITKRSFYKMNLNIGKEVWAAFKANAVRVI